MGFSAQNLTFRYPQATAAVCKDFSVVAADGALIAILGRNGTGKTTLLRLLAGLERPTAEDGAEGHPNSSMEVFEGSQRIVKTDQRTWRKCLTSHATLVFQQSTNVLFEWQTVDKAMQWVRPQQDDYYVNVVSLFPSLALPAGDSRDRKYWGQLSAGQKQALAVARGLLRDPDILLMDEPFASFDATLRLKFQESLVKSHSILGKKHRVMVLVTHNIDEAVFLANRILIVDGPPLRVVKDISCATPLVNRDSKYRCSAEFINAREAVLKEFN